MLKPLQQTGYIQLHDKEIMLIASNVTVAPTNYLAHEVKYASRKHKVLFIYEEPISEFGDFQPFLENENTDIMYIENLSIEDIEHYLSDNKPEYIYIDYFISINTQQDFTNDSDKIAYLLSKLREYADKYDVRFIIADRYKTKVDPKSIYLADTYDKVNCVWIVKLDTMTRIK